MKIDGFTKLAVNWLKNGLTDANFADMMQKIGFHNPTHEYTSKGMVWVGKNFVVKSAHFENKDKIPPRKFRCPMKYLGVIDCEHWMVQPRCQHVTKEQFDFAVSIGYFDQKTLKEFDVHEENVGIYKGRLLIFDW